MTFLFIRIGMNWNIGDKINLCFKLKSKLELYHVELTATKISREKLTLFVVEMEQLPDVEKTDYGDKISFPKWTIYNGWRKICVIFETDTDDLNIVLSCYRKILYLKSIENDLKLTETSRSWQNQFSLLFPLLWHIFQVVHFIGWNNCS